MMKLSKILIFLLVLLGAYPARATITRAQTGVNGSAGSVTITSSVLGDLITVQTCSGNASATFTISDNKGNTYTAFSGLANWDPSGGNHGETCWYGYTVDAFGAVTSVTIGGGGGGQTESVGQFHSTNGWPANPTDKSSNHFVDSGGTTSFTSNSTASITQASELLIGVFFSRPQNPGAITQGGSWNLDVNSGLVGDLTLSTAYQIVSSIATYAYTGTNASAADESATIMTFKDNPAPAGSRFVRLQFPPNTYDAGRWAITDRERARA